MPDLSRLAPLDRAAVLLAARPGVTYRMVAALLGESEQETRTRIRRALLALRPGLQPSV